MSSEIWKDIVGFEGSYQVSNLGRVKSLPKYAGRSLRGERIKGTIISKCGYVKVNVYKNNSHKQVSVHRLVAEAFIPNPNNKPQVNHIDGNKENNSVSNLEWCDTSENLKHAIETGLRTFSNHTKTILFDTETGEEMVFDTEKLACEYLGKNPKFLSHKSRLLGEKEFQYKNLKVKLVKS